MTPGFYPEKFLVSTQDGHNFELASPVTYVSKAGESIVIPAGSTSDGASTPPSLWLTLPPFGKYWRAAFLHDYLYRVTSREKSECDNLLKEAMELLGCERIEVDAIYEGVHLFGWSSFKADRELNGGLNA